MYVLARECLSEHQHPQQYFTLVSNRDHELRMLPKLSMILKEVKEKPRVALYSSKTVTGMWENGRADDHPLLLYKTRLHLRLPQDDLDVIRGIR